MLQLSIRGVVKRYRGNVLGLDDFSLEIGPGVLGLLGPNGAGKSTLMRILATVTRPTAGVVTWNGADITRDPDSLRAVLGYLPQDFGVYPNLSALEFLEYVAAAKGLAGRAARARIEALLELVNLTDAARRPLGGFSGGMRQRVGIAQALLNDPRLLIVDEPTAGLDPEERVRFRNLLAELSGERIVILSTHIVSDVEATAGRIALIQRGRLVARGDARGAAGHCRRTGVGVDGADERVRGSKGAAAGQRHRAARGRPARARGGRRRAGAGGAARGADARRCLSDGAGEHAGRGRAGGAMTRPPAACGAA